MGDKFVGFHVEGSGEPIPVSTGATRDEALALAMQRVLFAGGRSGSIGAAKQEKLTDDEFQKLAETLDKFFAGRGLPRSEP